MTSILDNVKTGRIEEPYRIFLYAEEKIGKTKFGADSEVPIFQCAERGTERLDVARLPQAKTWSDVLDQLRALHKEQHFYKTLVVDTLDWIEQDLLWPHVCAKHKWDNIEAPGYGKGFNYCKQEWNIYLDELERVRDAGMNILLLAHCVVKVHDMPDQEPYSRFIPAIHDKSTAKILQWCDGILFAKQEVTVRGEVKTKGGQTIRPGKGVAGQRVIHTAPSAAHKAGMRVGFELPPTLPLSFQAFASALDKDWEAELVSALSSLPEEVAVDQKKWVDSQPDRRLAIETLVKKVSETKA